jgi:hypothetical protein
LNKTNPSSDHHRQTKRIHVASDISDDDFVWVYPIKNSILHW